MGKRLEDYKQLLREEELLAGRILKLRAQLSKNCKHPAEFVTTYRWEHDNGYGRQSMHTGYLCTICRARDPWQDKRFIAEKDFNTDW